ncbi:MAG: TonB-dependent receptor [Bryobacteraceae bacterium]
MKLLQAAWLVVLLLLLCTSPALSQFSASIQGVVQDASQSVIPDVTVKLRNIETGVSQEAKSNESGYYRFGSLAPGNYEISASAAAFQPHVLTLTLTAGQTRDLNIALAVKAATERVEVVAEAAPLDTAETRIQVTMSKENLRDLPIQDNNILSVIAVAPGVTGGAGSGPGDNFSPEYWPGVSANGRDPSGNLFTLDGLNVTSNITNGTLNIAPNTDAVQELTIETNTFTVDQGQSSSLRVNVTSKSGTNSFHGSGLYTFTNQDLEARTEFTDHYEPFKVHRISGTLGGPIRKNKSFFFAAVEDLRSQSSSATNVETFESPEFVNWAKQNFANSLGTKILTEAPLVNVGITGVNQTAQDVFGSTCGTAVTSFIPCDLPMVDEGRFKPSPYRNGVQYTFRFDQYIRSKDRIYANYLEGGSDNENPAIRKDLTSVSSYEETGVQANWTHTFSPTLLSELSFGGYKVLGNAVKSGPFHIPDINIQGVGTGISPGWSGLYVQHNYNWREVVSWIRGSHTLKFGGSYWTGDDWADFSAAYGRPQYFFRSLLDLVQDKPYSETGVGYDPLTGQPRQYLFGAKQDNYGLFAQDQWKARPNLTLTMGLRWDDFGNPSGIKTYNYSNIVPGSGTMDQQFASAVVKSSKNPFAHRLNRNFSPRFGVAYAPGKDQKWSIRGGVGIYHDIVTIGETIDNLRANPPGFIYPTFTVSTSTKPVFSEGTQDKFPFGFQYPTIPAGQLNSAGGLVGTQPDVGGINRNLTPPSTVNWALGVERQLPGRLVVGANYTGSHTWNGLIGSDFNRFAGDLLDGTLNRLNPNFGSMWYVYSGNSINYSAMILSMRKDMGTRYSFQASYTLGRTTDLYQGGARSWGYEDLPDQHKLSSNRADSSWDVRNRFSFSGVYRIPTPFESSVLSKRAFGGWELSSVTILESGTPYTVITRNPFDPLLDGSGKVIGLLPDSGDYNADGFNYDFPNAPTAKLSSSYSRQQYINGVFSASDFPAPTVGNAGTEKRNTFRNPGVVTVNASLIKNNPLAFINEAANLQLRFEFFNVLNRVNLGGVDNNLGSGTFGRVTSTRDPRIIQLGARFVF